MPKTILVLAEKGGVGKTTVYDEVCWSLDRTETPYACYDLDGQGGACHPTAKAAGAEVAVIDTPGVVTDDWPDLIRMADLVVVPTRASGRDLSSFGRTLSTVQADRRPEAKVLVALNGHNRYRMASQMVEHLQGMPEASFDALATLSQSEAVAQASVYQRSAVELSPRSPGARDVARLVDVVRRLVGLPEEHALPY